MAQRLPDRPPVRVLLPAGDPLAASEAIALCALREETWIRPHDGSAARLLDAVTHQARMAPKLVLAGRGDRRRRPASRVVESSARVAGYVFAHGLLRHLRTRICLDESAVPESVPANRRDTLLAERTDDGYRFDIRIQGPGETVFFDV